MLFPSSFFPSFLLSSFPLSFFSLSFNTQQRTVADLNTNLISEVDTISTEFRNVYELARERAENHANEGWTSKPMQSRLVHENEELRQTIIDTNEKQNELYSDLERKLEEHDETRRTEVMVALKTAHDVKAAHIDRIHQLEIQLSRRDRIMKRLEKISSRVGMDVSELVNRIAQGTV